MVFLTKKSVLYIISFTLWMSRAGRVEVWDSESVELYPVEKPDLVCAHLLRKMFLLTVFNNFTVFKKALETKIRPLITALTLKMQVQFLAWRLPSCGLGIPSNPNHSMISPCAITSLQNWENSTAAMSYYPLTEGNKDICNLESVSWYGFGLTLILLAFGRKSPWLEVSTCGKSQIHIF